MNYNILDQYKYIAHNVLNSLIITVNKRNYDKMYYLFIFFFIQVNPRQQWPLGAGWY